MYFLSNIYGIFIEVILNNAQGNLELQKWPDYTNSVIKLEVVTNIQTKQNKTKQK